LISTLSMRYPVSITSASSAMYLVKYHFIRMSIYFSNIQESHDDNMPG